MGAMDCRANKRPEEGRSEADITSLHFNIRLSQSKSLYETLAPRVVSAKEELLSSADYCSLASTKEKNYDQYYAFLSTRILGSAGLSHCSTARNSETGLGRNHKPPLNPHTPSVLSPSSICSISRKSKKSAQARPKTRTKPRTSATSVLKISVDSPSSSMLSLTPASTEASIKTTIGKKTSPRGARKYSSGRVTSPPKTLLQLGSKKRLSTSAVGRAGEVQFDIISLLPDNVQSSIFSYIVGQYAQCLTVSAAWYTSILASYDALFSRMESTLALRAGEVALFRNSYMQCQWKKGDPGRLDRVIQLELLPGCEGRTLTLGYTYSFVNEEATVYMTQYKIDCKPRGKRMVWIDKVRDRRTGTVSAHSVNVVPVCVGDVFEIAVNYYTARGMIDVRSLEWLEPMTEVTPECATLAETSRTRSSLSPDQIREAKENLNRVCELEQTNPEWYDSRYYSMKGTVADLKVLEELFEINTVEYSAVDTKIRKIHLTAVRCGTASYFFIAIYRNAAKSRDRGQGGGAARGRDLRKRGQKTRTHDRPRLRNSVADWRRCGSVCR